MQDIKSRFWDRTNKKWEVFHIEIEVDPATGRGDAKLFHVAPDHGIGVLPKPDFDPASRGEFTTLKDRNDREIYEGDIINDPQTGHIYAVLYRGDRFMVERRLADQPGYEFADLLDVAESEQCEVIGTFYENPELIDEYAA